MSWTSSHLKQGPSASNSYKRAYCHRFRILANNAIRFSSRRAPSSVLLWWEMQSPRLLDRELLWERMENEFFQLWECGNYSNSHRSYVCLLSSNYYVSIMSSGCSNINKLYMREKPLRKFLVQCLRLLRYVLLIKVKLIAQLNSAELSKIHHLKF